MTDADLETLEDMQNTPLADVTDDSCVLQLIEIVPLDRPSDDYCKQERIDTVVEVKLEELQDVKQEPEDNYDFELEGPCFTTQVRFCYVFIYVTLKIYSHECFHAIYYHATHMYTADYAVARCLSVCHTPVLCLYISSQFLHHWV